MYTLSLYSRHPYILWVLHPFCLLWSSVHLDFHTRVLPTEGAREAMVSHFNLRIKKGPAVLVSKIRILLFKGVQKFYGPEILRFLLCMLQFLDNLRQVCIFSNCIREIITSCWTFCKDPILNPGPSESFSFWTIRKKTTIFKL